MADFFENIPLGVLAAVILVAIAPSAQNIMTIFRLFKQARLDYKVFREKVKNPLGERNIVVIPGNVTPNILVGEPPTISFEEAPGTEAQKPAEFIFGDTSATFSQTLNPSHMRQTTISSVQTRSSCGTADHLIKKVPLSVRICEYMTIWGDFVIWLVTFLVVLMIDVSAGIYAGLVLIVLLSGIQVLSKP